MKFSLKRCERFDGIIFGACISASEESVTWVDDDCVIAENFNQALTKENTWIKAKEMKWRIADEFIGDKEVYITR